MKVWNGKVREEGGGGGSEGCVVDGGWWVVGSGLVRNSPEFSSDAADISQKVMQVRPPLSRQTNQILLLKQPNFRIKKLQDMHGKDVKMDIQQIKNPTESHNDTKGRNSGASLRFGSHPLLDLQRTPTPKPNADLKDRLTLFHPLSRRLQPLFISLLTTVKIHPVTASVGRLHIMERVLGLFSSRASRVDKGTSASPPTNPTQGPDIPEPGISLTEEPSAPKHTPKETLQRMLSTKTCLKRPVFSGFDRHEDPKQLGKGQCGEIWRLQDCVLKIPNEGKLDQLWNDCCNHKKVQEAFGQVPSDLRKDINIPHFESWIQPSTALFWFDLQRYLPKNFQPTYGILSQKICALPPPVCEALFDVFAPESIKNTKLKFFTRPESQDCLVRLYLGRRLERSTNALFKMRNFDLMVNEMEDLDLDTPFFATVMANALAVLHWKAGIDGDDVEFVLGRVPRLQQAPSAAEMEDVGLDSAILGEFVKLDVRQRSVGVWLLDFNQCQKFPQTDAGIQQLERAFRWNDPYFPRPGSDHPKDVALWEVFKTSYLDASRRLTDSDMPVRFIAAVESQGRLRPSVSAIFD